MVMKIWPLRSFALHRAAAIFAAAILLIFVFVIELKF